MICKLCNKEFIPMVSQDGAHRLVDMCRDCYRESKKVPVYDTLRIGKEIKQTLIGYRYPHI